MSTEFREERIERLIWEVRRRDLILLLTWMVPGSIILASLLVVWVFGRQHAWVQIFDWISTAAFFTWMAIIILLWKGPRFIREYVFGPDRELSEEQKADEARQEEIRKGFEKLTRPVSWIFRLSAYGIVLNFIMWKDGEIKTSTEFFIITSSLVAILCLSIWAHRRIAAAYDR